MFSSKNDNVELNSAELFDNSELYQYIISSKPQEEYYITPTDAFPTQENVQGIEKPTSNSNATTVQFSYEPFVSKKYLTSKSDDKDRNTSVDSCHEASTPIPVWFKNSAAELKKRNSGAAKKDSEKYKSQGLWDANKNELWSAYLNVSDNKKKKRPTGLIYKVSEKPSVRVHTQLAWFEQPFPPYNTKKLRPTLVSNNSSEPNKEIKNSSTEDLTSKPAMSPGSKK